MLGAWGAGVARGASPDPAYCMCLSGALLKTRIPSPSWDLFLSAFFPFPREAFAEGRD